MKIIAIGDIHGRDHWKQIVAKEHFDKLIFIGDYFDSHDETGPARQKKNFKEMMAYKEHNPGKVVLLTGNHGYHYLENAGETYGGYQVKQKESIRALLQPAVDEGLLQMCFAWRHLLFSHAGVTKTWCHHNRIPTDHPAKAINALFKADPGAFGFTPGMHNDPLGNEAEQTPIWVRPESLLKDGLDTWIQVVGHTVQQKLARIGNVFFIDTLGTSGEYFIYKDGKFSVGKLG